MVQAALPSHFEAVVSPEQEQAEQGYRLFLHIRSGASGASSPNLVRTLELMLVVLQTRAFGHPMPPADMDVLVRLSAEHDWEGTYERAQAEQELGPEDRHLREHLLWLRLQIPGYKAAIEGHATVMQTNGFATWDDARVGEKIWNTYFTAVKETDAIESRLRSRIDEYKQATLRTRRIDQIYGMLLGHYAGRGPQYEITCRTLATITADIEAARRPGVRASQEGVDILVRLVQLQQGLVNQLQKFTESTKVDVTDGQVLRELAEAIATCALRRLIPVQPQMAAEIVDDMERELLARGIPGVQAMVPIDITSAPQTKESA